MSGKTRLYILTDEKKPASWQVRGRALIEDEKKGLREIIYIRGGHSIFKDDYDKNIQLNATELWFEDGSLLVNPKDLLLVKYLEAHPDFKDKFKLDDPEADAVEKLKKIKMQDKVKAELIKLESFDALVQALARKDEQTLHLTPAQKELRCYEEGQKDPEKVLKALGDPKTETKYMVALAMQKGIIRLNTTKTNIIWGDSQDVIIPLPLGQKPEDILSEFLFEPKGEGTMAELIKRVDVLGVVKAKKAKSTSKK